MFRRFDLGDMMMVFPKYKSCVLICFNFVFEFKLSLGDDPLTNNPVSHDHRMAMANALWFVIIARASCVHHAPRDADLLEGKETKTAVRDHIQGMMFASAFALDRWSCQWNIWFAEWCSFSDSR